MTKVDKRVFYYPNENVNCITTSGMCNFSFKGRQGTYRGKYEIFIHPIVNNAVVVGSKILFYLTLSSGVKERVFLNIKNYALSDYNIMKIFRLVSKQSNSRLYGLNIISYTIDEIDSSLCVLYDLNTTKLGLYGIPRYLFIHGDINFSTSRTSECISLPTGSGDFNFTIYGLSSLDSVYKIFNISQDNALYHVHGVIERLKETYTLIYMHEFFNAGCADENGNINESYFESLSGTEELFDALDGYCYLNWFLIPFDLESCFSDSKMILDIAEKFTDTYIKGQVWGEYLEL